MQSKRFSNSAAPVVDEKGALGAASRLREYCELVSRGDYGGAYQMWSDKGRASGQAMPDFRETVSQYQSFDCYLGTPGGLEGAAGSVYVEIPLKVTGTLSKGGAFTLEGPVTLRRINDVPGSTDEQRRWHIQSIALRPAE